MNNIAKSLIGLAITGITVAGSYYGWNNLDFNSDSLDSWKRRNLDWFNKNWRPFYGKVRAIGSDNGLFNEWTSWKKKYSESNRSIEELELSKKFKEWCEAEPKDSEFTKVRQEGCKT
ncbi:hypothetical protein A6V39_01515 [Candidatus Mycoplasma haematobovis]|uniref:Uncharacterized protein n=1 Tax=Candidatus Mycoplasma haematobovis TaxID=432608 RepID=A0A1A9QF10_9MOLU|nr:hypothetical protein [Candidatus Mycoplasma haematobovis]OAL10724.1 hypothetical protein A6V39_01515 [Candidatus Mycoplasma haematobovis]